MRSASDRVLLHIELKADPASGEFIFEGELQDIASELGLTREAFYRALAGLERSGRIRPQRPEPSLSIAARLIWIIWCFGTR